MCQECEPKFALIESQLSQLHIDKALLEQRIASIEGHHPVMDANTADAHQVAEEALAVAEQAQEQAEEAQEAATMAVMAALESEENHADSGRETSGEAPSEPAIPTEEEEEQPVLIAVEPERRAGSDSPVRFRRGR